MASGIVFEDLTGVSSKDFDNPYDALLTASDNDPAKLQLFYQAHREKRVQQQKNKILDPGFEEWNIDPILAQLDGPRRDPDFVDPRNCLVLWAQPPSGVRDLIAEIQQALSKVAPDLWCMPKANLHTTAMEITHSKTAEEIEALVEIIRDSAAALTDYPLTHRPRLIKPMIGFDSSALALTFVPAAGEALHAGRTIEDDQYSYHQFRKELFNLCQEAGISIASRYCVPSAHLTVARFIGQDGFLQDDGQSLDHAKVKSLIDKITELNQWLEREYWPVEGQAIKRGGEWIIGQEQGLRFQKGRLWYGGGETIRLGAGF